MTGGSDETRRSFDTNVFLRQAEVLDVVLDHLTQGIVVVGSDYRLLAFNRQFEELLQLPSGSVEVGVDFRDILRTWAEVTGQDQQMLDRAILRLDMATPFESEFPQRIKGERRCCLLTHNPLPGKGFVRTFTDISDRKQVEEALRASQELFAKAFRSSPQALGITGLDDGRLIDVNDSFSRTLGYSREEAVGHTTLELGLWLNPEDRTRWVAALREQGYVRSLEVEVRTKGGHPATMLMSSELVEVADRSCMLSTFYDITERRQGEDELKVMTDRFSLASRAGGVGVWDFDTVNNRLIWDDQMYRLYGITADQFSGAYEAWKAGLHPEDLARGDDEIQLALRGEKDFDTEFRVLWPDGSVHFIRALAIIQRDASGQPLRMIGTNWDITEHKKAEGEKLKLQAQLQQSQKMQSLGTLAGGVAHDMNNVLGAILGLASAHIDTQPYGSPLHQALDTIIKATERGGKMVKSLLSFARQSPAENNLLDMNAILQEQVSLLARTTLAKVRLQVDLEPNLRPIRGDASALTHACMNLCVNAVDAMPGNGTLTLHTRNVDSDWIEVLVEDTGTGMPKEVLEKALDPFFTTKGVGQGTGLGLSMVFSTVKAHQGRMEIQSEPGRGTRVSLRFPACENEAEVPAPAAAKATIPLHGTLKVLLVDDDELIQCSVQALLEGLGHSANIAQSGEEALVMLGAGFEPDLVLLDMNMPGLGGAGTLTRLRGLLPRVPVVLSTGRTDQTALALASAHPGVTLLSKPFGLRELQKHLENIGLG